MTKHSTRGVLVTLHQGHHWPRSPGSLRDLAVSTETLTLSQRDAARVRFEVVKQAGWLCQVLAQADWPLGQLTADPAGLSLAPSLFGDEAFSVRIPWSAVRSLKRTLTGLRIQSARAKTCWTPPSTAPSSGGVAAALAGQS